MIFFILSRYLTIESASEKKFQHGITSRKLLFKKGNLRHKFFKLIEAAINDFEPLAKICFGVLNIFFTATD